jgi:archaeosine synthase
MQAYTEIEGRSFAARTGAFVTGGRSLKLPAVLFAAVNGKVFPEDAEAVLASSPVEKGMFTFISSRNSMLDGEAQSQISDGLVRLPNYIPFSPSISGVSAAAGHGAAGDIFMSSASPEEMARELESGRTIYVMTAAPEFSRRPEVLASAVTTMRSAVGWRPLIYAPGVATPANLKLLCYAGIDIVDTLLTDMESFRGNSFVGGSLYRGEPFRLGLCHCSACVARSGSSIFEHNRLMMLDELNRTRVAVAEGRIREEVEKSSAGDAWNTEFLRHLDTGHFDYFERVAGNSGRINAISDISLRRADIVRYTRRIMRGYRPPEGMRIAVLVPCSSTKPYLYSKSHRLFYDALSQSRAAPSIHMLTVTSPLGVVPEELETVFPAAHYDIPVTGLWSPDEMSRSVEMLIEIIRRGRYEMIISHLEDERDFINSALSAEGIDYTDTSEGHTRTRDSLQRLASASLEMNQAAVGWKERNRNFAAGILAYQFGEGGRKLVEGADVRGKFPVLRIMKGETQLGMLTDARGVVSLTIDGAERIRAHVKEYCIAMRNFRLRGNLFTVGVEKAGDAIRTGDEVIVENGDEVAGVGVARMSAWEMNSGLKGEAVRIRHYSRKGMEMEADDAFRPTPPDSNLNNHIQ